MKYHGFKSCETYLLGSLRLGQCGEGGDVCIINVFYNVVVDVGSTYRSLNKAIGITLFQIPGGKKNITTKSDLMIYGTVNKIINIFSYLDLIYDLIYSMDVGFGYDYL